MSPRRSDHLIPRSAAYVQSRQDPVAIGRGLGDVSTDPSLSSPPVPGEHLLAVLTALVRIVRGTQRNVGVKKDLDGLQKRWAPYGTSAGHRWNELRRSCSSVFPLGYFLLLVRVGNGMVATQLDETLVEGMGDDVVVVGARLQGAVTEGFDLQGGTRASEAEVPHP